MSEAVITFPIFGESFSLNFSNYFTVFGFKIYLYGVIIAFGFLLGSLYIFRRAKDFGLTVDNTLDMLICAVPTAIVCARLCFVLFYQSNGVNPYFANPIKILQIRDGGLAIYGGITGAVAATFLYSKFKKVSFGSLLDVGGLGLLIGQSIGRWGNFTNREAYGFETGVPWKMGLTLEGVTKYVHPTFLYESLWNVLGFLLLHIYTKKRKRQYNGQIFIMYMAWYGLGRFFIESMRTDSLYLLNTGLRVNQLIAAGAVLAALVLHFVIMKKKAGENE